jgi:cellobiose phosphorylase
LQGDFWSFSEDGKEFSLTRRDLRTPWRNYLFTDRLKSTLTHTGMGPSFDRSPHNDRLMRDDNPRLVFVRDQETGDVWTVNGVDTPQQPADWMCTHGFGYTRLSSKTKEIAGSVTYFVPVAEPTEVWRIRLENTGSRERRLRVFPCVLWRFGLATYETGFDNVFFRDGMIVGECHHWPWIDFRSTYDKYNRSWDRVGFMAASPAPSGYDCVYERFAGEGNSVLRADAVREGACRNSSKKGEESCGVLQLDVTLAPGATADLVVLAGMAGDAAEAARIRAGYGTPALADAAFTALKQWWDEYLGRMRIDLPDRDITTFANGWHRCNMFMRYYLRFGLRDTAQDMGAVAAYDPPRALERTKLIHEAQFQDGCTRHDVHILGAIHHRTINSDLPLWVPWLTGRVIRETGDYDLLDQTRPFADGGEGTVYEHCRRAIDYIERESGRFGLPLLKCGDWNDCLIGSAKAGVSVWMGMLYHITLMEMHALATRTGRTDDAGRFLARAQELAASINANCWDGRWYVRAWDDDGVAIGSHVEEEGRIWVNPQSWAIMAGIAPADRARASMEAVEELMDTPVGIPLLAPPYTKIQQRIGLLSRYAPGHHHNGSSWHHAVTWAMLAECRIGRADRALDLYRRLLPAYLSQKYPRHKVEPYAYSSYTDTPMSGELGRTGIAWNSGTVCWMYRVLFEGFAGITPEYDGLRVDPSLPAEWRRLTVKRPYRGAVYHIAIEGLGNATQGVKELHMNGTRIDGPLLPILPRGEEAQVRVVVG